MKTTNNTQINFTKKINSFLNIPTISITLALLFFFPSCYDDGNSDKFYLKTDKYEIEEITPEARDESLPEINRSISSSSSSSNEYYTFINQYLGYNPDAPGWPALPRRVLNITDSANHQTTLSFGSKGSIFDIFEWETTKSIVFTMGSNHQLMLMKTSYDAESMITEEIDGKIYLNVEDGVGFIGQCIYDTSMNIGYRFLGKVSISGNGISQQEDLARNTTITQNTNFIPIKEGDTIDDLMLTCNRLYTKKVKRNMSRDLRNVIKSYFQLTGPSEMDNLTTAIDAALYGYEKGPLKIFDYQWTVSPAVWYKPAGAANLANSGTFILKGKIVRNRDYWFDATVTYDAKFQDGELIEKSISVGTGRAWQKAAHQLIDLIINELHHEFNTSISEINPGQKKVVTFFKDRDYDGASLALGEGHYPGTFLADHGFAKNISSVHVPEGFKVKLCFFESLKGYKLSINESKPWIGDWQNDKVQAVIIEKTNDNVNYYSMNSEYTNPSYSNKLKILGKTVWGFKHVDNGYFQMIEKDSGKCLSYDENINFVLENCDSSNEFQLWAIEEVFDDKDITIRKGVYEIISKLESYQISLNKNVLQDKKTTVLQKGTPNGNKNQYWKFTNAPERAVLSCRTECREEKNGCHTETICEDVCDLK